VNLWLKTLKVVHSSAKWWSDQRNQLIPQDPSNVSREKVSFVYLCYGIRKILQQYEVVEIYSFRNWVGDFGTTMEDNCSGAWCFIKALRSSTNIMTRLIGYATLEFCRKGVLVNMLALMSFCHHGSKKSKMLHLNVDFQLWTVSSSRDSIFFAHLGIWFGFVGVIPPLVPSKFCECEYSSTLFFQSILLWVSINYGMLLDLLLWVFLCHVC